MKTAFEVVGAHEEGDRYMVMTHGWSSGKGKWHGTEEEARADAEKKSRRKVRPAMHIEPYHYPYSVTRYKNGGGYEDVALYYKGEETPEEEFDRWGHHKTDPLYRGDQL